MLKKFLLISAVLIMTASYGFAGNVQTFGVGANATAQGEAVAAYANDPFAVYYNPAGLTLIEKPVISTGVMIYDATIEISNFKVGENGTSQDFESDCDTIINPHIGFAMPINENFAFGIAMYAPYGLHAKWDPNPVNNPGALYAWETEFYRQTISPTLACKVSDKLSFGLGVSLGKSVSNASKTLPDNVTELRLESEDSFNVSVNFGAMYMPIEEVSIGLTYRGRTDADFKGDYIIGGINMGSVEMEFDHPESIQGGVRYFFSENLSAEFDMTWTRWSILEEQTEYFNPPLFGMVPSVTHEREWEDTIQYKIGTEWKATEAFALRGGITYDPTPVPDHTFDFGWPDTDRTVINLGAGYTINENWSVDSVLQYVNSTPTREINGESVELEKAYGDAVYLEDEGTLWGLGFTVNYTF